MIEDMRVGQELLKEEILTKMETHHGWTMARMDFRFEKMEDCVGKTETTDLEAKSRRNRFRGGA
jgi:hypothetical protein